VILFKKNSVFRFWFLVHLSFLFFGCGEEKKVVSKTSFLLEGGGVKDSLGAQALLYLAYEKSGENYDDSVDVLVQKYREALLGNLFWEEYQSTRISVDMEEIRSYYLTNRVRFQRTTNQLRLLSFVLTDVETALSVKQVLEQNNPKTRMTIIADHGVSPSTISPGVMPQAIDEILFNSVFRRGVIGPIESNLGFHVFELLDFFPSGSFRGLEEVYDEVSQEIYRSKRLTLFSFLLDSLTLEYKKTVDNIKTEEVQD
tara:strand:- start:24530 stop:25297 length:768 start_codon:yes stop_codon:yes gene_type:complete